MINEFGFDNVLRKFYGYGITGLVRENIQNSLDAKLKSKDTPVIVKINTGKHQMKDVPGFEEIKKRIGVLEPRNQYSKETLDYMNKFLNKNAFDYITFEDENTKGLSGAYDEGVNQGKTPYGAYAYNKGNHFSDGDNDSEWMRGGSHGVGKIASNAASIFHMMFFANKDEKGIETLGGTVHLMEHSIGEKSYRATGFFTDESEHHDFKPYKNEHQNRMFEKKTRGLKIIVPFLHPDFNHETSIIQTVCDSFLLSILENRLIVYINNQSIDQNTIKEIVKTKEYFEQSYDSMSDYFTPLYIHTYENDYYKDLVVNDKQNNEYKFNLYFKYNDEIKNGRTGIFRTLGMKIEDHKVYRNVTKTYNAILIPKGRREDKYLKSLENESHTQLSYEHINDPDSKSNAKRFINNIDREIGEIIDKFTREKHPTSGEMDTSDIIYYLDDKFKESMEKRVSYIDSNKGKRGKHVVKTSDTEYPGQSQRHKKGGNKPPKQSRPMKKNFGDDGKTVYYQLPNTIVRRSFIRDREKVYIDLSKTKSRLNASNANLLVSLVDGMGKEYYDEFNLKDEYQNIEDINAQKKLEFGNSSIKSIDISKNTIILNFTPKKNSTAHLSKFRYYLEV